MAVASEECGAHRYVYGDLLREVARLAGADRAAEAERCLRCALQVHDGGDHFAVVLELDGPDSGALWVRWGRSAEVAPLPDCPASADDGREACASFRGHHGLHSWELGRAG